MEETTLAYVAGLLDGEGHIAISVSHAPLPYRTKRHRLVVGIAMCEESVIRWLASEFNANVYLKYPNGKDRRTICYAADWQAVKALNFLQLIRPWLRVKSAHADVAIEFQESVSAWWASHPHGGRYHPLPIEEIERRHSFYLRISAMNLRKGRNGYHSP